MSEKYPAFPKIPRLHRDVILTEKIDGTNGLISIREWEGDVLYPGEVIIRVDSVPFGIRAGSRNRWLTLEQDNFDFAKWVYFNARELVECLGAGNHYGEWWGSGIQRGYGLPKGEKRFSLFNTGRWNAENTPECVHVVPVLAITTADVLNDAVFYQSEALRVGGSVASPGFMKPEGIVVYHVAGGHTYKVLLEGDDRPKGEVA